MIIYKKARNEADLEEIQRLRYRVFCQERMIEPEEQYPSGRERDLYDQYAIHVIARHFDLIPVGTARLVRSNPLGLPVERFCEISVSQKEKSAEISKLAVSKMAIKIAGARQRDVLMGLVRCLYQESTTLGIQYWYASLTESMHRLLSSYGIRLARMEKTIEYSERVIPYVIEIQELDNLMLLQDPLPHHVPRSSNPSPPYNAPHRGRKPKVMIH